MGSRLYRSEGDVPTMCIACHGAEAAGGVLGPNLRDAEWLWSDGSVAGIGKSISEGVAQPKSYRNPHAADGRLSTDGRAGLGPGRIPLGGEPSALACRSGRFRRLYVT